MRRPALSTTLLGATLALAVTLAWLAARAGSAQRRSVATTLHNYADIAAWQYARAGRTGLNNALNGSMSFIVREFLRPVRGGPAGMFSLVAPTELPGPELLRRVLTAEPCECVNAKYARTFFRVTPDRVVLVDGDSISDATRGALVPIALGDSALWGRRNVRIVAPGVPALARHDDFVLLFRVRLPSLASRRAELAPSRGPPRPPARPTPMPLEPISAVYGMIVGTPPLEKVLRAAMSDAQVLAPSLLERMRGTSFVTIQIAAADGTPVFVSAPATDTTYASADTLGTLLGGLHVRASLDGPVAARVLLSGTPGPGSGVIAALLVLALAFGAGALLLLRREQQLVRLRQDFVSGVSHELRTPLTQIRLHSELLLQDGFKSDPERRRAMAVVHRESLRMTNLVDNVLQFARLRRPEAAPAMPPAATVDLHDVAREVGELFQPLAAESGATLTTDANDSVRVSADRDAVTQIFCNLVENALKYGPRGQAVHVTVTSAGARARITVDDEGQGIPSAERERIWEPYYRLARDRNAPAGGSGLGLSVVAELVGALGGRCAVETAPSGGARFVVEVPALA